MSKEKVSEKVQEAIFNQLALKPGNNECADCGNRSPTWVSLDFGVFVCIRCSGVHRQIGPHITRVRSTRLDGWQKENIEIMAAVGNKLANDFYEYKMPSGYRKPGANSSPEECRRFIDEKYIRKAFSPPGYKEPVKEFIAARERGEKPNFEFSSNKQTQETEQHQEESRGYLRKKSMSLDKLPSDGKGNEVKVTEAQKKIHQPHHNHHEVDLLSADNDLLGGGGGSHANNDHNDFGDFKQAETHSASPVKKINFAGFKKASQEQAQPQPQSQTNWAWDMGTADQSTGQQSGNSNNNNAQNTHQNQTQQQQQQQKVDVMKLYTQPTVHQNHFMQGMQGMHGMQNQGMQGMYGMQNQGWNQQNAGGWNNQGFGGQMGGMQQNFAQGGFHQQQQQGNFGGYNQNMGQMGGFGQNMGQMGGFNQGQMYGNSNGYQNNNGFVQQQAGANNNRFF